MVAIPQPLTRYVLLFTLVSILLLSLEIPVLGYSEIEQRQITRDINEIFDLTTTQKLSYQFPLWLDWVGTHARVRLIGGVLEGSIPASLEFQIQLDDVVYQQTFNQKQSLQPHYTFHADSEYVVMIPPPTHPDLEGVQTLHKFIVELAFTFSSIPQGIGIIHQVVFETFRPALLKPSELRAIIPVQDQFSWRITTWSFGSYFFSTPLNLVLSQPRNVTLLVSVEFNGLDLDGWVLSIEQGVEQIEIRDQLILEGTLELDPTLPCELILVMDPPRVSEPQIVSVSIQVQGTAHASPEEHLSSNTSDSTLTQSFVEIMMLLQVGMLLVPLILFYRTRHVQTYRKEATR